MPRASTNRSLGSKFVVFFLLYFVQGMPYGLQTRFLPLSFRMRGMTLRHVGFFKLLMLPWVLKAIWAPLVDNYFTKKKWLNGCLIALALLCIVASFTTPDYVFHLSIVMFVFNLATSIQDVALDTIVLETLEPSQLAKGNIAQVVGYKTGGLFAGGIFSLFTEIISWEAIFISLAFIYMIGLFISISFLPQESVIQSDQLSQSQSERRMRRESVSGMEDPNSMPHSQETVMGQALYCYFWKLFDTPGTKWMFFFVMFYKIGEQGVLNMFPMFLLDNEVSPQTVGFWTGFAGQSFSVLGSFLGGIMDSRWLFSNLKTIIIIRGFSVFAIWVGVSLWSSYNSLCYACSVFALQLVFLTGGAITTLTFTWVMQLSQKTPRKCRASHYTVLVTGDVLGRLLFSSMMGALTQSLGYAFVFALFNIVSFLAPIYMMFAPPSIRAL